MILRIFSCFFQGISDEENPKADEYIGEGLKIRNGVTEQIEKCDDDSFGNYCF